jgi:two-component system OmpR family response regulator
MAIPDKIILLVEDDEVMALTLSRYLEKQNFRVITETDGNNVLAAIERHDPDALILDLNLPGKDGFEVCREVRASFDDPIIMLTARDEDIDQIIGLELGADDYITKPAEPRLIHARLKAIMRRRDTVTNSVNRQDSHSFGNFSINKSTRSVKLGGEEITLTTADFDLLWLLASSAGRIVSRDDIQKNLRGIEHDGLDRSIDMKISRLRKRLGDDTDNPNRIKTVRGKGYLFNTTGWD